MNKFIQKISLPLKILILIGAIALTTQYVLAWQDPTQPPPDGNVPAPLNVGTSAQVKNGNIGLNFLTVFTNAPQILFNEEDTLKKWYLVADNNTWGVREDNTSGTSERLTIKNGGNVGIGITSPTQKLDVNGYVRGSTGLCIVDDCRTAWPNGGTGGIDGSGTVNYLPKWTAGTTLGNSIASQSGTVLTVAGTVKITGGAPGIGKVLTGTDALGNANWQTPTGGGGVDSVTGGAGITAAPTTGAVVVSAKCAGTCGTNYVGKFNSSGLPIQSSIFDNGSGVGIGNAAPGTYKLNVTGSTLSTNYYAASGGGYYYLSDRSAKTNIKPLEDALAKITKLQGVSFNYKEGGEKSIGLIAQDVEKVYPEIVSTNLEDGKKEVDYGKLIAPLIEAVKTQQKEIDDLKAQINELTT